MIQLAHRSEFRQHEKWHMEVTEPGTRKLGLPLKIFDPGNKYKFLGRPIIDFGVLVYEDGGENMIVTDGLEFVVDMLIDTSAVYDTGIIDQAEGTDNTAPAAGQTTLVAEAARKEMTSRSRAGVVGTLSTFFTGAEANDNIKEAGIFGGTGALHAGNPDTGVMFSRWLASYDNSLGAYDITFTYILTPSYS